MRYGIREICNVVLRAKAKQKLGNRTFYKNEPVLYFDTLKTSSLEGASTTVYAQGGRGNPRLIGWDGERTLTFTMEDALISPEGFAILSGAGLLAATEDAPVYLHTTAQVECEDADTIVVKGNVCWNGGRTKEDKERNKTLTGMKNGLIVEETALSDTEVMGNFIYHAEADIYCMKLREGLVEVEPCVPKYVYYDAASDTTIIKCCANGTAGHSVPEDQEACIIPGDIVLVDYYVQRKGNVLTSEITPDKFGGSYYLEADCLFREESTGVDMPAIFVIPNCKVQSNFTFSMASSGDPSEQRRSAA